MFSLDYVTIFFIMKSSSKLQKGSQTKLTVTLDPADVKPYFDRVHAKAIASVELKGFRPGAAPAHLAEQAIDQAKVIEHAVEEAIRATLATIIEDNTWIVLDRPSVEITSTDKPALDAGLTYVATLTLFPEVKLPDYQKIAKKIVAEQHEMSVTDAEVEQSFTWLRKSRAPQIAVARPVQTGDVVEVSIKTSTNGKSLPGGDIPEDKFEFGASRFIPGFEKNLEGHKAGDEVAFSLTAPADYWQQDLRNKTLEFHVRIKNIFELTLPAIDDAFAVSLGSNFKTIADVQQNIRDGLRAEKLEKEQERKRVAMITEIANGATIDVPEILITRTLDQMMEEFKETIQGANVPDEKARQSLRPAAMKRVMAHLVIAEMAKREGLEPTKEEVEEESKHHQSETRGLDAGKFYDYIYGVLLNKKVFAFLEK